MSSQPARDGAGGGTGDARGRYDRTVARASGELGASDWLLYQGAWYYSGDWSEMVTGWQFSDGTWYLFGVDGALIS